MRRPARLIAAVALAVGSALLAGCATSTVRLADASKPSSTRKGLLAGCSLQLLGVVDGRKDTGPLGTVAGRQVSSEEAIAWLRANLADSMALVEPADGATGTGLRFELVLASIRSIATSMSANIVTKVAFERDGAVLEERTVRGVYTRVNWGSGTGEIGSAMRGAVDDMTTKLLPDLRKLCASSG